jgi:hypothetical protein
MTSTVGHATRRGLLRDSRGVDGPSPLNSDDDEI